MTDEERKAKDAARKREAYARRKAALSPKHPTHYEGNPTPDHEEAWRMVQTDGKPISAEDIVHYVDSREKAEANLSDNLPTPQEELALRIAKANGIDVPPGVLYQDHREHARAVQADSTARAEYVEMLFQKYSKTTNIPQLLAGLIREQIETRVVMTDILAEILKGVNR